NCDDQTSDTMPYGSSSFSIAAINADNLETWKREPTIAHQLSTFPDGTLIITTKEGHVTTIAPDKKTSYINYDQNDKSHLIADGISALGCSTQNSNILAVGSNNSTITVFDISKKTIQERKIHSITFKNSTLITSICFTLTDDIYFSTQHSIFFLPQNKNQNHKSIYETQSFIKCIAISDNSIACLINKDNNYGISIINTKDISSLICHDLGTTPITSLCLHKTKEQLYLITSDIKGDVTIYSINNDKLSVYVTLKQASPIPFAPTTFVTTTKDNKYIVIKTTQIGTNGDILCNTILHYPTPGDFNNQYDIYTKTLENLGDAITKNTTNGPTLYKALTTYHNFIYANNTDQQRKPYRENIIPMIIKEINKIEETEVIPSDPITSIEKIKNQFPNSYVYYEINIALSNKIVALLLSVKNKSSTNED